MLPVLAGLHFLVTARFGDAVQAQSLHPPKTTWAVCCLLLQVVQAPRTRAGCALLVAGPPAAAPSPASRAASATAARRGPGQTVNAH
jgi:hypothetical protein